MVSGRHLAFPKLRDDFLRDHKKIVWAANSNAFTKKTNSAAF